MSDIVGLIEEKLCEIEKSEQVKILYAVESGSRAWGVASPDSDYDVRFIYVRPVRDYLKLAEVRDVIEWQLDEVLDMNGWDLKKTLQQFHRGNATLFEWSRSPVVYKKTAVWEEICQVAENWFSEKAALYHYWGTARSTYSQYLTEPYVSYKKYIYALRPLLACRYIEENHAVPPVLFDKLTEYCLPESLKTEITELLELKSRSEEKALYPQLPAIQSYISAELERLEGKIKQMPEDRKKDWTGLEQIFFRTLGISE